MLVSNRWATWIGYGLSGLVIAFMLFDGGIKLVPLDVVITATAELGYPASVGFARGLGILWSCLYSALRLPADLRPGRDPADCLSRWDGRNASARRQSSFQSHALWRLSRDHALGRPLPARRPLARTHSVSPLGYLLTGGGLQRPP